MFIISLNYKKSLDDIELYLIQHREFLERYYQAGVFILSGPKVPRTGGVILVNSMDKKSYKRSLKKTRSIIMIWLITILLNLYPPRINLKTLLIWSEKFLVTLFLKPFNLFPVPYISLFCFDSLFIVACMNFKLMPVWIKKIK